MYVSFPCGDRMAALAVTVWPPFAIQCNALGNDAEGGKRQRTLSIFEDTQRCVGVPVGVAVQVYIAFWMARKV